MPAGLEQQPYRMEALATLPVFLKLAGKPVIVAGGSPPAVWKAELLAASGAHVRVLSDSPCPEMIELAGRVAGESVTILSRRWAADDLVGAAVAIGAIEDDDEARAFRDAARSAGVPVNVIDKPAFCDFQFGTIVTRSPLVIGISTDGAAPVFGQAIRTRIEALLPQSLRAWAEAARAWRPVVQMRNLSFQARRRFWEAFSDRALSASSHPTDQDQAACFTAAEGDSSGKPGEIALIGSGPGTSDLLTLAAVAALQSADVVLHDVDLQFETIGMARRELQKILAASESEARGHALRFIEDGRRVAWLGTGNPHICQRWREREAAFAGLRVVKVEALTRCPACDGLCRHPAGETYFATEP